MTSPSVVAVIPAAGIGSRMQTDRPKQYLTLLGKTILEHTVQVLLHHHAIDYVIIAISPGDQFFYSLAIAHHPKVRVVDGGAERANSVLNAVETLPADTWALVHDAARPCVSENDISALLRVINDDKVTGGILATPVRDTMKRSIPDTHQSNASPFTRVSHTESRENLWHALTPQLFPAALLASALKSALKAGATITDEASAIEWSGRQVALVNSDPANIKITHPADLPLAKFYLQQRENKAPAQCE